jgi:hypothetical protein
MTGIRGTGKTTTARIHDRALRPVRALPRHCRGPSCRRDGDGRGLAHRGGRHPRNH